MLIDACVNLLNGQFREDREQVMARATAAGVMGMLITATDLETAAAAIKLCHAPNAYCTAGVHPHDAAAVPVQWREQLAELAAHPLVRAVGETGLDFNRNYSPRDAQIGIFDAQIELAREIDKTLFVHDRESGGEVLHRLQAHGNLPSVLIHCFTGTSSELENYLAAGFYIGITGWITDPRRGGPLADLVPHIPLNRLVLETDAPFLRPHNVSRADGIPAKFKRRNEPALLPYVLDAVAALRPETRDEIAAAVRTNAVRLFGFECA